MRQLENQLDQANRIITRPTSSGSPRDAHGSSPASVGQGSADSGDSLASELKWLSLEATAERFLGQSSGLSFARLTQAVLKRLRPDQYPFAFERSARDSQQTVETETTAPTDSVYANTYTGQTLDLTSIIDEEGAVYLAECYWSHNHTLYPFVQKSSFIRNLKHMYTQSDNLDLQSHSWL